MKDLNAAIEGIHDVNAIRAVNLQPGRQLKVSESGSALAKVIQKPAFAVEDLHDSPETVDDVKMSFGIEADSFWTEHRSRAVPNVPNGIVERAGAVQHLNAEVHCVHHEELRTVQPQLCRIVEFPLAGSILPDRHQDAALHVHHENLVAQRVSDINALLCRVDRDAGGALEKSLPVFQAADHATEFSAGIENENLARLGIGHINIVLRVDRDTLRHQHRVLAAVFAGNEFVFLLGEVEDVNPVGPRVGDDDAPAR